MKILVGSRIGGIFLLLFSWVVRVLDGGWVRGYVWSRGLRRVVYSFTMNVRSKHFVIVGTLVFFRMLIWLFVCIFLN